MTKCDYREQQGYYSHIPNPTPKLVKCQNDANKENGGKTLRATKAKTTQQKPLAKYCRDHASYIDYILTTCRVPSFTYYKRYIKPNWKKQAKKEVKK